MDYFVSTTGDDASNGKFSSPFKTIRKGLNAVAGGDKLIIREGVYRGDVGWFPANATKEKPIRIEAFSGEKVTISALVELTGWQYVGNNIYRTQMPFTMCGESTALAGEDFLTCNSKVLNEAQWPSANVNEYPQTSSGWASVDDGGWEGDITAPEITGRIEDADLSRFPTNSLIGGYITILPGARWTLLSGKITGNQGAFLTFRAKNPGGASFYKPDNRSLYFLFGKKEFLSPGTWWRDTESSFVYVWLPNGSNPNNEIIEAKKHNKLMDFWGRDNFHLKDINFVGATIHTPKTSNLSIRGCTFKNYSHRLYFQTIWSYFKPAVYVTGDDYVIADCDFLDGVGPAISAENNKGLTIENCTVKNCMTVDFTGVDAKFIQNTVSDTPGPCLRLFKTCGNAQVSNNDLGLSGKMYTDEGILLISKGCVGGESKISHNFIHDGLAAADGTKEFYGSAGIYFDNPIEAIFHHNIVCRTTSPSVNLVGTNWLDAPGKGLRFYNNTLGSEPGVYWIPPTHGGKMSDCEFVNNYITKQAKNTQFYPGISFKNNIFGEISRDGLPATNVLAVIPNFNSDFSLKPNSPLKEMGIPLAGITSTTPPDIGAFEGDFPIFGAVVRQKDLPQIKATVVVAQAIAKITLRNLPTLRKVGANFLIRVGTGKPSSDVNNVPVNPKLGSDIFATVDGDEWVKIGAVTIPKITNRVVVINYSGFGDYQLALKSPPSNNQPYQMALKAN